MYRPDRLFPADPRGREVARRIYRRVRDLPIISPHGHVEASFLAENKRLPNPAELLIYPDHYVTRLLHTLGISMDLLSSSASTGADHARASGEDHARASWAALAEKWKFLRGTVVHYWLSVQLQVIFGIEKELSPQSATSIYDQIEAKLGAEDFLPRRLFDRFDISVLATTDSPVDDLGAHEQLAKLPNFSGQVIPTFRPDPFLEPGQREWPRYIEQLSQVAEVDCGSYGGWVAAMENRREYFRKHGAKSTDHSHLTAHAAPLEGAEAQRIYTAALTGTASREEADALRGHMLFEMARMSADDGLTMTLHPGIERSHHQATLQRYGPDTGHDIPVQLELTRALKPMLNHFGTAARFKLVVFTVDETVYSRELAPLAGFYPSVYIGAPWWFLDTNDAIQRWRSAITETAGFYKTSGFIDDTRAFVSIPVRHDMARRIDASYLARLVTEERLTEPEAHEIAHDLVEAIPRSVFNL